MKKQALILACVMAFSNVIAQTLPQGALPILIGAYITPSPTEATNPAYGER